VQEGKGAAVKKCKNCGKEFEPVCNRQKHCCPECRIVYSWKRQKDRQKTGQNRKQKEKKKKQTSTLADQNKKARACGLSYGKYVAQKYAPAVRKKNIHCSVKENIKTYGKG
jgi:bacteriophage lambda ninG protein